MIKVIPNFLNQEQMDMLISYINNNLDKAYSTKEQTRWALMLGRDNYQDASNTDLDRLGEIKDWVINQYWPMLINACKETFNDNQELYVASFWLAKQIKGGFIDLHSDNDGGRNMHFKWSAVVYLNTVESDGVLEFPNISYSYSPVAGDLVLFPSQGDESKHEVKVISSERYTTPVWITADPAYKMV
jgi:2OG-Fe(II) oxygenase superfamily